MRVARGQIVVNGDDEPQRGVDGVVFRQAAAVGETVRHHAFGDRVGPFEQDRFRFLMPARREQQTAHRDEGIAAPVGEPRKARDDRLADVAPDDVGIGAAREPRAERRTALRFARCEQRCACRCGFVEWFLVARVGVQDQYGFAARKIEGEDAGRREVLGEIQPAFAFAHVAEVAVPVGACW